MSLSKKAKEFLTVALTDSAISQEFSETIDGATAVAGSAIPSSEKGAANGVATLDGSGKIPSSQLTLDAMEYKGNWNASTNSPALADGIGSSGDVYRVSVAATRNLGSGDMTFNIGDQVIYNGAVWELSENSSLLFNQIRYVNLSGNDTTGDGSLEKPCLTLDYMLTLITDQSDSNSYIIYVGPGVYEVQPGFEFKSFVGISGSGKKDTFIGTTDNSPLLWNKGTGNEFLNIYNCNIYTGISASVASGSAASSGLLILNSEIRATFSATGSAAEPLGLLVENSNFRFIPSGMALHATAGTISNSELTAVSLDSTGTDGDNPLSSMALHNTRHLGLTVAGNSGMNVLGGTFTGGNTTLDGTVASITYDSNGHPVPENPILLGGALSTQVAKKTRAWSMQYIPSLSSKWSNFAAQYTVHSALEVLTSLDATSLQRGYLTAADWSTFNGKVSESDIPLDTAVIIADGITGKLVKSTGVLIDSSNNVTGANNLSVNGSFSAVATGGGLKIKEGANAKMGTAVLAAGTVTVANTSVTAGSRIFVTSQVDGGSPGFLRISNIIASTSFDIVSGSGTDTSTVAWVILEAL